MTPRIAVQVEHMRTRFDGDVQLLHHFNDTAVVLCTPRGSTPLCTSAELMDYLDQHPQATLAFWDDIHDMRVPFLLGLNDASFRTLACALPRLQAVK